MKRFKNILVYIQTSLRQHPALMQAKDLALNNQAKLTLVDVIEGYALTPDFDDDLPDAVFMALEQGTLERLERIAEPLRAEGIEVNLKVLWGKPSLELTKAVLEHDYDLVLKTADGKRAFRQIMFGTIAIQLFRKCPCPIWVVKPDVDGELKRLAVAVDVFHRESAPELNQTLLDLAISLAEFYQSELHLIHAWHIYGADILKPRLSKSTLSQIETKTSDTRHQLLEELKRSVPKEQITQTHLIQGDVNHIIPEFVVDQDIDLLIMGTQGRTGTRGFIMGNTAENLLHSVDCSVLTIKPDGFESPVKV